MTEREHYQGSDECKAFYNHLFSCRACFGPTSRYCDEGWRLYGLYDVPLTAISILDMPSLFMRRSALDKIHPRIKEAVAAEVSRIWAERKGSTSRGR